MTDSHNGSNPTKLRIGSRGSQLALWQANHISALLRARGHEIEIEIIHTTGDKITDVALAMVGTKGMFTKEIEEALAAGRVDLAVHSLKDLPTELPPGFEIAAITERQDPRDAFCSRHYRQLSGTAPGRARRHLQPAPPGATQGRPPRSRHSSSARQRRHPPAQTRAGRIRRHHPRLGRPEAPRQDGTHQANHSRRNHVPRRRTRRARHRNPLRATPRRASIWNS